MEHKRLETVSLKTSTELNEAWVQQVISEDPSILGLGDVILRDKERRQPRGGRLDLLLQDSDTDKRYEVEIQLGATDESHIIRAIEYWDVERKRYPQYDHCAVLIAEQITGRFQNIIGLFNGHIPLIAIQVTAVKTGDSVGLLFTKILDEMSLGPDDSGDEAVEPADREYWLKRGTKATLDMTDQILTMVQALDGRIQLKYNKFYIGLSVDGIANNFVSCRPKKRWLSLEIRLTNSEDFNQKMEDAGLDAQYLSKWGKYVVRFREGDIQNNQELVGEMLKAAHTESSA